MSPSAVELFNDHKEWAQEIGRKWHRGLSEGFIQRLPVEECEDEALLALWEAAERGAARSNFKTFARSRIGFALLDLITARKRGDAKRAKDAEIAHRERGGK